MSVTVLLRIQKGRTLLNVSFINQSENTFELHLQLDRKSKLLPQNPPERQHIIQQVFSKMN